MSSGAHKTTTLRQVDAVFANLDLSEVAQKYLMDDVQLTARQVVKRYYPQLLQMQQQGFTYEKLCEFLLDTFEFSITPRTLRDYMNAAKEIEEAKRSPQVSHKRKGRSTKPESSMPSIVPIYKTEVGSQPPLATAHPVVTVAPQPNPSVVSTKPLTSHPASTQSSGARSQPSPVVPSSDSENAPIAKFSPEELEAALAIPEPGDKAATEEFLQALQQLKTVDPSRWRKLQTKATNQGINILGIVMPSSAHLFNQY